MKKQISAYIPDELIVRLEDERARMSSLAGAEISRNAAMASVLQRGLANNEPESQKVL